MRDSSIEAHLRRMYEEKEFNKNPFEWQGKPSVFSKDNRFNGVNLGISEKASEGLKTCSQISLSGSSKGVAPKPVKVRKV